jgi:hypothetical protein
VKTLEEIENELLASNQPNKSSPDLSSSSMPKTQSQSASNDMSSNPNLSKLFSMLNTGNQNGNQQMLKQQQQQQIGNNFDADNTQMLMLKQKQLLEQFELSQKQAQLQQLKVNSDRH